MKKTQFLMACAVSLMLLQSCGSKSANNEKAMATRDSIANQHRLDSAKKATDKLDREKARAERKKLAEARKAKETYDVSGVTVYNRAEAKPEFKGGKDAMAKYFKDNLNYPPNAENPSWKGTVYVEFVVGVDGKVQFAEITDETDDDTEQLFKDEALRVVTGMPAWVPGKQRGKAVPVAYNLPIYFAGQ